jgi:hypothetical protein
MSTPRELQELADLLNRSADSLYSSGQFISGLEARIKADELKRKADQILVDKAKDIK